MILAAVLFVPLDILVTVYLFSQYEKVKNSVYKIDKEITSRLTGDR